MKLKILTLFIAVIATSTTFSQVVPPPVPPPPPPGLPIDSGATLLFFVAILYGAKKLNKKS